MTRIAAVIFASATGKRRSCSAKAARLLKKIGTDARLDIEKMVGTRSFSNCSSRSRPVGAIRGRSSKNWIGAVNCSRSAGCRSRSREAASGSPFRGDAASAVVAGVYGDLPRHSKYSCIWSASP